MIVEVVISSGHSLYVRGACGIIDEVVEARRVASKVAELLGATEYHDNTSRTQTANINGIVAFHNKQARDLDVSVHFNAASATDAARGVEVLYYSDGTKALAAKVSAAIAKAGGLKDRGAKKRTDLGFLKRTNKPAILIEVCFVDSKADVTAYKNNFEAICEAIAESISGKKAKGVVVAAQVVAQVKTQAKPQIASVYAREAQEWVIAQGISDGSDPFENVTRQQVWAMLHRMATKGAK
ncbi:N-acetylmuramoyl-L-alanine amidase [Peribacillus huizhouensis]|uniref:N-acetylmuramoyl-L-alanine amidase n=1 Tax=Peribacillus huizhouensis TaxID=1501239 RepID=A0ABR6CR34_9BACI|nr:N-acetylmuramoyl-L-alanine amidase [Peribacillus huizhouensis]MBA9027502.1 N-acetylmuramoyl-L-alanine amidase [Peribacillus huizhouensis]